MGSHNSFIMLLLLVPSNLGHLHGSRTDLGPEKVLESLKEIYTFPWHDVEVVKLEKVGDQEELFEAIARALEVERAIVIGGDHSITWPSFLSFKERVDLLLYFDAHLDCCKDFEIPSHESVLFKLSDLSKRTLVIGARNYTEEEMDFLQSRASIIEMSEIRENGFDWLKRMIMDLCEGKRVYVSFDVDVLDPCFAPGTYHREPGGLSSREALEIARILKESFICFDIVEYDPTLDFNGITGKLVAYMVHELLRPNLRRI